MSSRKTNDLSHLLYDALWVSACSTAKLTTQLFFCMGYGEYLRVCLGIPTPLLKNCYISFGL